MSTMCKSAFWFALCVAGACAAASCKKATLNKPTSAEAAVQAESGRPGGLGLMFALPAGVNAGYVTYSIEAKENAARTGRMPVTGGGATFSLNLDDLAPGGGYLLKLTGPDTADGACRGTSMFQVVSGAQTHVIVNMRCPGLRAGAVGQAIVAGGSVNDCAVLDSFVAAPLEAAVGSVVRLMGDASDSDEGPKPLSYQWYARGASLSADGEAQVELTCDKAGDVEVNLKVSDGDCGQSYRQIIQCKTAEEMAASGDSTTLTCRDCEKAPHRDDKSCPDSLARCESMRGSTSANSPIKPGMAKSELCKEILACMQRNRCARDRGTDCLCGASVDPQDCFAGAYADMHGPCKDLISAGAESTDVADLARRFTDPTYAIGAAYTVIETCDQMYCVKPCF